MNLKYIPDKTGRFRLRPHYPPEVLDHECEEIITTFMREVCGEVDFPIPTDVITKLIERDTQYLDLYADLSKEEGANVEGVTDFQPGFKPIVRVASVLSEGDNRSHRLRTTLTHEYGHVKFHDYLYQEGDPSHSLFPDAFERKPAKCKRENMLDAPISDWMEWQAGYVCGSILMPVSYVKKAVGDFIIENNASGVSGEASKEGMILIATIAEVFDVSPEAARVRLLKLKHLIPGKTPTRLY